MSASLRIVFFLSASFFAYTTAQAQTRYDPFGRRIPKDVEQTAPQPERPKLRIKAPPPPPERPKMVIKTLPPPPERPKLAIRPLPSPANPPKLLIRPLPPSTQTSERTIMPRGSTTFVEDPDFLTNVGDRIFFRSNSSVIDGSSTPTLVRQVGWLRRHPEYGIVIEGHAQDSVSASSDLGLGARRALALRNRLVEFGLPSQRVKTISYGRTMPVAVCPDESCAAQNRRAVIRLTK